MAISRRFNGDHGVPTELHRVPTAFLLAIDCALMALSRRFHCVHRVVTARALRVHGTPNALTAFCLHSEVIEITGRVLIPQALLDGEYQSIFPKSKTYTFQTRINNTLLIPLTQIYVIKSH